MTWVPCRRRPMQPLSRRSRYVLLPTFRLARLPSRSSHSAKWDTSATHMGTTPSRVCSDCPPKRQGPSLPSARRGPSKSLRARWPLRGPSTRAACLWPLARPPQHMGYTPSGGGTPSRKISPKGSGKSEAGSDGLRPPDALALEKPPRQGVGEGRKGKRVAIGTATCKEVAQVQRYDPGGTGHAKNCLDLVAAAG